MEVQRYEKPKKIFRKEIRKLCNKHKITLIFDECTTGFRETYGGLHKKYKVYPDMAMFGKAMGNGYAINAIIGKKIMKGAEKSFIVALFGQKRLVQLQFRNNRGNKKITIMEKNYY